MKGTEKYWDYVEAGLHGRLWISKGTHARGNTLRVFVVPDGATIGPNGPPSNAPICDPPAVEVFGILRGQPGWTEEYGWKHKGPWVEDFEKLIESGRLDAEHKAAMREAKDADEYERRITEEKTVLDNYKRGERSQ